MYQENYFCFFFRMGVFWEEKIWNVKAKCSEKNYLDGNHSRLCRPRQMCCCFLLSGRGFCCRLGWHLEHLLVCCTTRLEKITSQWARLQEEENQATFFLKGFFALFLPTQFGRGMESFHAAAATAELRSSPHSKCLEVVLSGNLKYFWNQDHNKILRANLRLKQLKTLTLILVTRAAGMLGWSVRQGARIACRFLTFLSSELGGKTGQVRVNTAVSFSQLSPKRYILPKCPGRKSLRIYSDW